MSASSSQSLTFASLFSGAGIGDTGLRAAGLEATVMCEIEPERSALGSLNFPEAEHFAEDIHSVLRPYVPRVVSSFLYGTLPRDVEER